MSLATHPCVSAAVRPRHNDGRGWMLSFPIPAALLTGGAVLQWRTGVPLSDLTRDPWAVNGGAGLHVGAFSHIGVMVWTATAAVCLFTAYVLYRRRQHRRALFLAAPGALSVALAKDDLFMIHEHLLPTYLSIPEQAVFTVYALSIAVWFFIFRGDIARTPWPLLVASAILLAGSILMDQPPR